MCLLVSSSRYRWSSCRLLATRKMRFNTRDWRLMDLTTTLNRLRLQNPILVASGTFGYAREMAGAVDFSKLGGAISKTVTHEPRKGNAPPRTIETASGMLNAIGLDNDSIDHFIAYHLP